MKSLLIGCILLLACVIMVCLPFLPTRWADAGVKVVMGLMAAAVVVVGTL